MTLADIATTVLALPAHDPFDAAATQAARSLGLAVESIESTPLMFLDGAFGDAEVRLIATQLLADPLLHRWVVDDRRATAGDGTADAPLVVEVVRRAGVTDPEANELMAAASRLGISMRGAATGRRYDITGSLNDEQLDLLVRRVLANPVIEDIALGTVTPTFAAELDDAVTPLETYAVASMTDEQLSALNVERGMALDPAELQALRTFAGEQRRDLTDIELETIAQTWSEHCAHKTFRAAITTTTGETVEPLLAQLRRSTDEIAAPWVVSAFVGNAGIVEFEPGHQLAIKVETHNHPSAVEPFGGANTGVGGVVRDVMAAPAHPVAATDVLCFGPLDTPVSALPAGVLPPQRIADGVVAGVADYGNKLGLPTVAGAVLFDRGYVANPLVFCGCVGRVHLGAAKLTTPQPGDRVVVVGGAAGRDGIRGATFSSMTMDATTGTVAGASVQIGDPIVEKLLIDLLDEIIDREQPLIRALTDCGAGGLSSAVGEMADGVGADVELDLVPRKYPGLAPWEVWLSEAQERMVLAVAPEQVGAIRSAAERHGVLLADIGAFTGDERLVVRSGGTAVLDLSTSFLHHGRPRRQLVAERTPAVAASSVQAPSVESPSEADAAELLERLLAHPNIASKAATIHRYDHEVQASTIVRPLVGAELDGHADGVVIGLPTDTHGFAVSVGVNPWFGELDAKRMAHSVVDEAIRNVVVAGADPTKVALLDNFSWGDPRRPSTLGQLVDAVEGCVEAAALYGSPFVSGKDSLNNEYLGDDGVRHAIPPTLVITALAHVTDVEASVTPDLKRAGNVLMLLGDTRDELGASHANLVLGREGGSVPGPDVDAPARYRGFHAAVTAGLISAAHDCAEGGLAVALAEMAIGGRLGVDVELTIDAAGGAGLARDAFTSLFSESNGRIVVEVAPEHVDRVATLVPGSVRVIGRVTETGDVRIAAGPVTIARPVAKLHARWTGQR